MAKAPRPPAPKTPALIIKLGEQSWRLETNEVTPDDIRVLRKALGISFRELINQVGTDIDLDIAAGLILMARRQTEGRWVTFEQASAGLTYDSVFEIDIDDDGTPAEVDDSPQA